MKSIANGVNYPPGKVPTTLILHTLDYGGANLTVNVDKTLEMCKDDPDQALDALRNLGVATNAVSQMLVFEKELKGELAPPPGSGIRPETVFAVGRTVHSPRERGFVVIRSRGELKVGLCPNWEQHDDYDNKQFVYVLPGHSPTAKEREIAEASLREIGIVINRRHGNEQDHEVDKRQEQRRGFSRGL